MVLAKVGAVARMVDYSQHDMGDEKNCTYIYIVIKMTDEIF
jgi:hypothetical protein